MDRLKPLPKHLQEEATRLFNDYIAKTKGPFVHEDMIKYVREKASKELLAYLPKQ